MASYEVIIGDNIGAQDSSQSGRIANRLVSDGIGISDAERHEDFYYIVRIADQISSPDGISKESSQKRMVSDLAYTYEHQLRTGYLQTVTLADAIGFGDHMFDLTEGPIEVLPEGVMVEEGFGPGYPMKEYDNVFVFSTEFERGTEQRGPMMWGSRPEWDLNYFSTISSAHVDVVRDFVAAHKRSSKPFLFREPYLTTRDHVIIGNGDGNRTNWLVPVYDASSMVFSVNSVAASVTVNSGAGANALPVVAFDSAPALDSIVTVSYSEGFYCPMVVVKDVFQFSVEGPPGYGVIKFTVREARCGYPLS